MKKMLLLPVLLMVACAVNRPPVVTTSPPPPVPVVEVDHSTKAVHVEGHRFVDAEGHEWKWRGATDFLLLKKYLDHEDITPILDQRQAAGANLVRVFAMCQNISHFSPVEYAQGNLWYWDGMVEFVDLLAKRGLYVEITAFADAQLVMPGTATQVAHWQGFSRLAGKPNVFLELVNENSHADNTIDTNAFQPIAGLLNSHGSEQSDMHPVEPAWDYAVYHARRDAPPDARGATNYDASEFEARFPKPRPEIADEGIKTTDPAFAALAGAHANIHNGGTFHSQSGVTSALWTDAELAAARAFYEAIK